jgi:hypothetical protein
LRQAADRRGNASAFQVASESRTLTDELLEPSHRRLLVLRRSLLRVEPHELECVLERKVRELTRGVLGHPKRAALDRAAEADVGVRLRRHERMFSSSRPASPLLVGLLARGKDVVPVGPQCLGSQFDHESQHLLNRNPTAWYMATGESLVSYLSSRP